MSESFVINIAQHNIEVHPMYDAVRMMCTDYLADSDAVPDFGVEIGQEDIERERSISQEDIPFQDSYLETLAVYRKICEHLLDYETFLMHGSLVEVDGEGYLFIATSGTGKSTHTRLWRQMFGSRAIMINDDKPLIKIEKEDMHLLGVYGYGTPWNGKHRLGCNRAVKMKAIIELTRDETNHIERLNRQEIYPVLLRQTYRPFSPVLLGKTLNYLDDILSPASGIRFYRLGCNMDPEAAEVAYRGMQEQ